MLSSAGGLVMVDVPAPTPAADSGNVDSAAGEAAENLDVVSSAGGLQIVSLPDTRGPTSTLAVSTAADAVSTEETVATSEVAGAPSAADDAASETASEVAVSGMSTLSLGTIRRPFAHKGI